MPDRVSVVKKEMGPWLYFLRPSDNARDRVDVKGKYLFFSSCKRVLESIARIELAQMGFMVAKISIDPGSNFDHVLCLYWKDNSRKDELAGRYKTMTNVKYRYWKSDEATRAGEYSEEFLNG